MTGYTKTGSSVDHDGYVDERTRSPRESYLELTAFAPLRESSSSLTAARPGLTVAGVDVGGPAGYDDQATRSPRQSRVDLAELYAEEVSYDDEDNAETHALASPSHDLSPTRSPRESYVALNELPSLSRPRTSRIAEDEAATEYVSPPSALSARRSYVASGEIVRDSSESANGYQPSTESITSYAIPRKSQAQISVAPVNDSRFTGVIESHEIEEVSYAHASNDGYAPAYEEQAYEEHAPDELRTDETHAAQQEYVPGASGPLDYDALKRYLFDEPASAPPPRRSAPSYPQHEMPVTDGTLDIGTYERNAQARFQAPAPKPVATIRGGFLAQPQHAPAAFAPTDIDLNATPVKPLQPFAKRRMPSMPQAMPERAQLARAVDAVRETLAQSIAAREQRDLHVSTPPMPMRAPFGSRPAFQPAPGYDPYASSSSQPIPPSPSSVDSPWIIPAGPSSTRRRSGDVPTHRSSAKTLRLTLTMLAAAIVTLMTAGVVIAAVLIVRDEPKKANAASNAPSIPVPVAVDENPAPPPAPTTMVIAPPPSMDLPPVTEAAPAKAKAAPAAPAAAQPASEPKAKSAPATVAPPTNPAAATSGAPAKGAKPSTANGKPKSVEQILDELGEEQLKR